MKARDRQYVYPLVTEVPFIREPITHDDFIGGGEIMMEDLGPRLIELHESRRDFYTGQLEKTVQDLARVSLLYSGQLSLEVRDDE